MKAYVMKPGDYFKRLAFTGCFDAEEAWNHAKNDAVRALRQEAVKLRAGDVVFIPDREDAGVRFQSGQTNRYRAAVPKVTTEVQFFSGDAPLANAECEIIDEEGEYIMGKTDAEGRLKLEAPIVAKKLTVFFPLGQAFTITLVA